MNRGADELKREVAQAAINYIDSWLLPSAVIGVGTGSTADCFIDLLCLQKHRFKAAVASSQRTADRLQAGGVPVLDLTQVQHMPVYVDGADEINPQGHMVKGGGGALTREKIVASQADRFVCIVDGSKLVDCLGGFALPIEVVPMAAAAIARRCQEIGGAPTLREGFVTDNGNVIIDVAGLQIHDPLSLEMQINQWPGVLTNGIFALQHADVALVAYQDGVQLKQYAS
jgi:ribose 5-phosphate isomerase A